MILVILSPSSISPSPPLLSARTGDVLPRISPSLRSLSSETLSCSNPLPLLACDPLSTRSSKLPRIPLVDPPFASAFAAGTTVKRGGGWGAWFAVALGLSPCWSMPARARLIASTRGCPVEWRLLDGETSSDALLGDLSVLPLSLCTSTAKCGGSDRTGVAGGYDGGPPPLGPGVGGLRAAGEEEGRREGDGVG